jgi:hydroxymethylbilane synthase
MASVIRIGSRPSRLALAQAELVRHKLSAVVPSVTIEIVPIRTSGDRMATAALAEVGGKGLFIKELEQALGDGQIDLAVHSMKDLPAELAAGFRIAAVPERADPRDALLSRAGRTIAALQRGARLGTSSARRRFEALRLRPDLRIVALRGNVDTRLARVGAGDFDAIILAMAGLMRLDRSDGDAARNVAVVPLDERDFVPCGGQGALCVEARVDRPLGGSGELEAAIALLDHPQAHLEAVAERAFLAALGASCVSPVGVFARLDTVTLTLRALVFSLDGARHMIDEISDEVGDDGAAGSTGARLERAARLGTRLAERMLAGGARALIAGDAGSAGAAAGGAVKSIPMPLHGRRIVITRAQDANRSFTAELRALGADVTEFPTIEIVAPDSYAAIDAALERVASFDWVIFTSATGVERMLERMKTHGTDLRALSDAKIGAIGPATAGRLAAHALTVAAMPAEYRAEAIVEAIGPARIRGARILIPRAQVAREVLPEMLMAAGAREVIVAAVYKTVRPERAPIDRVREMAAANAIDLVAFTSSSTVTNFCEMIDASVARGLKAAAIGPITAETARAAGMEVVTQPTEYTVPALIAAIRRYYLHDSDPRQKNEKNEKGGSK